MCAKNSSAEEISVATRQTHLPVTQSFPFMAPLYLCIWQGKTDFLLLYTEHWLPSLQKYIICSNISKICVGVCQVNRNTGEGWILRPPDGLKKAQTEKVNSTVILFLSEDKKQLWAGDAAHSEGEGVEEDRERPAECGHAKGIHFL